VIQGKRVRQPNFAGHLLHLSEKRSTFSLIRQKFFVAVDLRPVGRLATTNADIVLTVVSSGISIISLPDYKTNQEAH
jgi:hypothetical protein